MRAESGLVGGRAATRGVRLMASRCNARCYGGGWRQIYDPAVERERKELGVGLVARVATSEHFHLLASAEAPAVENDVTVLPLLEIPAHLLSFFFPFQLIHRCTPSILQILFI